MVVFLFEVYPIQRNAYRVVDTPNIRVELRHQLLLSSAYYYVKNPSPTAVLENGVLQERLSYAVVRGKKSVASLN